MDMSEKKTGSTRAIKRRVHPIKKKQLSNHMGVAVW